jgi:hypothetical protein
MKRMLATLGFLVALAPSALATQWYSVDPGKGYVCDVTSRPPQHWFDRLVAEGERPAYRITRDASGAIAMVDIHHGDGEDMLFFGSKDACEQARQILVDGGDIPNGNELK